MIGDNIRKIRQQRNMSQTELAEAVHVRRQTVSSWEINRTEPNMGLVELIAQALNCRKSDLIGEGGGPTQHRAKLSFEEDQVIRAYRKADVGTKAAVRKLLDVDYPVPIAAHAQDGATADQLASDAEMLRKAAQKK